MDRETVINHLQIIHTWAEFARERDLQFFTEKHLENMAQWSGDAISMLKEQEAVVRCKDCKHWWYGNYCDKHGKGQENADWFCTDGEKR